MLIANVLYLKFALEAKAYLQRNLPEKVCLAKLIDRQTAFPLDFKGYTPSPRPHLQLDGHNAKYVNFAD